MNIDKIITIMQTFSSSILIGKRGDPSEIIELYGMSKIQELYDISEEVLATYFREDRILLCGGIAYAVVDLLKKEGIDAKFIFLRHRTLSDFNFSLGKPFIKAIVSKDREEIVRFEGNLKVIPEDRSGTHAVIEVSLKEGKYIIDPTTALFYNSTKEDLLKGINVYDSYLFRDQYKYLNQSKHMCRGIFLWYATEVFWKNVVEWQYGHPS